MSEVTWGKTLNKFLSSTMPDEAKRELVGLLDMIQRGRQDITVFAEEMLGMSLNSFQRKFLTRTTTPRSLWMSKFGDEIEDIGGYLFGRNIAFPSNQVGKTVMIAIKHLWFCFYKIGYDLDDDLIDVVHYQTLNISPHSRQVKQAYTYLKDILNETFVITGEDGTRKVNKIHPVMKGFLVGENTQLGELRFRNGATFYTVPTGQDQASSLAGAQFGYISYDECSQSLHLKEEIGAKIMSRLIRYGVGLDLISTPEVDSPSHQYYLRICMMGLKGKDGWWSLNACLDDNIFIPKEQRDRAKADLLSTDKQKYRQVAFGEFISGGKRFFDVKEVERLWRASNKKLCVKGRKYLLISDWGMSDTGDNSIHMVFDFTDFQNNGKIYLVNHEVMKGGSPFMQFALLRTLYEQYTWYDGDNDTVSHKPIYVMDANSLGGVVIKKLLLQLTPKAFQIEKDEALFLLKKEMSAGRDFYESEVDGAIIERNPDFGNIICYYIEELNEQLGVYHIDDRKLEQDYVMCIMMGVSYIIKKFPRNTQQTATNFSTLAGYNAQIKNQPRRRVGGRISIIRT